MLALDLFVALILLSVAAVFAAVVLVVVRHFQQRKKRRDDMAAWALREGLSFTIEDPHRLDKLDLHLFSKGDGRGCENVVTGRWQDLDVRMADYWYYDDSSDGRGGSNRTYRRFSIVLATVDARFPGTRIERENAWSRLADRLAMRDLEFESDEFNRRFEVKAADREFAYKLVDARMMQWLLHASGPHCYEVSGPWVLGYCEELPVAKLTTLLDAVKGFVEKIPRLVWADYGKATS